MQTTAGEKRRGKVVGKGEGKGRKEEGRGCFQKIDITHKEKKKEEGGSAVGHT